MINVSHEPLFTHRLELRRTEVEDAAAMFEALRHPEIYIYVPRSAPTDAAEVAARFARVTHETAPDRTEQWLNWTVWQRDSGAPLGMIEATVNLDRSVSIGYLFDPRAWGRGYAREAVSAMLDYLRAHGAGGFEATIDIRNIASKNLVRAIGFEHLITNGLDELWRRQSG
ncbi:MAG: GNAT family N-acetyltransferase [Hyphomonadaceae bacterium]